MSLVRRNGDRFPTFGGIFDDFGRDLSDWFNNSPTHTTLPAVNVVEHKDQFEIEVAAPGMNKADFKIDLDDNILTISSEKETKDEVKDGDRVTRREFSYQSFQRTIQLPARVVDESKIKARYDNGILKIQVPKKEDAKTKPARTIAVE